MIVYPQQLIDQVNQEHENQHARRLLEEAGERVDLDNVHLLQVLLWGVSHLPVVKKFHYPVLLASESLLHAPPQKVVPLLLGRGQEEEQVSEAQVLDQHYLEDLAALLVNQVKDWLEEQDLV